MLDYVEWAEEHRPDLCKHAHRPEGESEAVDYEVDAKSQDAQNRAIVALKDPLDATTSSSSSHTAPTTTSSSTLAIDANASIQTEMDILRQLL